MQSGQPIYRTGDDENPEQNVPLIQGQQGKEYYEVEVVQCCSPFTAAWETVKKFPLFFVLTSLIMVVMMVPPSVIMFFAQGIHFNFNTTGNNTNGHLVEQFMISGALLLVVIFFEVFVYFIAAGFYYINLRITYEDNYTPYYSHLLAGITRFLKMTAYVFFVGIAINFCFIIPFTFLTIIMIFIGPIAVVFVQLAQAVTMILVTFFISFALLFGIEEYRENPIASVSFRFFTRSMKFVQRNFCYLIGYYLLAFLITLGLMLTIVGGFVAPAFIMISHVKVFHLLRGNDLIGGEVN